MDKSVEKGENSSRALHLAIAFMAGLALGVWLLVWGQELQGERDELQRLRILTGRQATMVDRIWALEHPELSAIMRNKGVSIYEAQRIMEADQALGGLKVEVQGEAR